MLRIFLLRLSFVAEVGTEFTALRRIAEEREMANPNAASFFKGWRMRSLRGNMRFAVTLES